MYGCKTHIPIITSRGGRDAKIGFAHAVKRCQSRNLIRVTGQIPASIEIEQNQISTFFAISILYPVKAPTTIGWRESCREPMERPNGLLLLPTIYVHTHGYYFD